MKIATNILVKNSCAKGSKDGKIIYECSAEAMCSAMYEIAWEAWREARPVEDYNEENERTTFEEWYYKEF